MALFNLGKKKEENKTPACCCSTETELEESKGCCCSADAVENTCCGSKVDGICCIKVLGAGCKTCHQQYEYAKAALSSMRLNVEVEYITDMEKVMAYGVMSMPALVVNEKVVSMGKLLKDTDIVTLLHKLGF